ncbi:YceI family protein [Helicobacter salomonis]|uniref:YceI family protein n=1 Tax=Helicobacter salomonis TaxID=56878 RepID=UPI000CF0C2D6|nr:YceI family protein [Helicobacter salomonis]
MKRVLQCLFVSCVLSAGLVAQEYEIDKAHSHVGFKVKHLKVSSVRGDFQDYSAIIDYDPASHTFKKLEATIKADSINTRNSKRDTHLRSDDFFKVAEYPDLHFVMHEYQKLDSKRGRVVGTLNIAGVSHKVVLQAEIGGIAQQNGRKKLGFSLNGKINRADFKFAPSTSIHSVGDAIALNIEVEAAQK